MPKQSWRALADHTLIATAKTENWQLPKLEPKPGNPPLFDPELNDSIDTINRDIQSWKEANSADRGQKEQVLKNNVSKFIAEVNRYASCQLAFKRLKNYDDFHQKLVQLENALNLGEKSKLLLTKASPQDNNNKNSNTLYVFQNGSNKLINYHKAPSPLTGQGGGNANHISDSAFDKALAKYLKEGNKPPRVIEGGVFQFILGGPRRSRIRYDFGSQEARDQFLALAIAEQQAEDKNKVQSVSATVKPVTPVPVSATVNPGENATSPQTPVSATVAPSPFTFSPS
ncbi:MAG: hypothetical protein A3F17_07610 [Gammaproteobacteria bacterium RIFCSPHIGHO2_12_FULL_41_15]|nr:MAG: hypothetical protein A3F17_07610 [Gammaproteobacteria bacterium RIFCSPHIGHO2_12_FULL_41_15]